MPLWLRNTIARKPSHFGSNEKPSPCGNWSTSFASIGSIGGARGKSAAFTPSGGAGGSDDARGRRSGMLRVVARRKRAARRRTVQSETVRAEIWDGTQSDGIRGHPDWATERRGLQSTPHRASSVRESLYVSQHQGVGELRAAGN